MLLEYFETIKPRIEMLIGKKKFHSNVISEDCINGFFYLETGLVLYFFFDERSIIIFNRSISSEDKMFIAKALLIGETKKTWFFNWGEKIPRIGLVNWRMLRDVIGRNKIMVPFLEKFSPYKR